MVSDQLMMNPTKTDVPWMVLKGLL